MQIHLQDRQIELKTFKQIGVGHWAKLWEPDTVDHYSAAFKFSKDLIIVFWKTEDNPHIINLKDTIPVERKWLDVGKNKIELLEVHVIPNV